MDEGSKMKNRLNRTDLTSPEWLEDQTIALKLLYSDFKSETNSSMDFQSFAIGMYMDTKHAANIANRRN